MFNLLELTMDSILKDNNPILRQKAKEVNIPLNSAMKTLILKMEKYIMESNDEEIAQFKNLDPALGIAAPQIGNSVRIFTMIKLEDESIETVINPKILKKSKKEAFLSAGEGCLSVKEKEDGYVYRPYEIEVEYINKQEEKVKRTYIGMQAIIFQHEYDHLEGKLYTDYINEKDPFYEKEGAVEF